jgi:hypothetical protein
VPEHWRRVAALPLAAAGYGVLLGLGFTTFVIKPSIFIDERDQHAAFCREVIMRVADLTR